MLLKAGDSRRIAQHWSLEEVHTCQVRLLQEDGAWDIPLTAEVSLSSAVASEHESMSGTRGRMPLA